MEPMTEIKMNQLPVRTWNQLGMNESVLKDEDARRYEDISQETPIWVFSGENKKEESFFSFACRNDENRGQEVGMTAEKGSVLTVWMEVSSAKEEEGLFDLKTRIRAGKYAKVRLVQVQLLGEKYRFVNDIKAECEEGAEVELLQLFLGGAKTWTGFCGSLEGTESSITAELGYWLRGRQRLDMNYVTFHKEKRTKSRILAKGVLEDEAFKLFRGTIDFKKGASGSEGEELEEVLMLGENAVNQTIPLILCGEEDVQGSHGATIGEPDEEMLFYLASRGIERSEAVGLLARAGIEGLSALIGNEEIEERVQKYVEEVTEYALQQKY